MKGGSDTAYGGADHDQVYAGADDDRSYGGRGRDVIYSGSGDNDIIFGHWDDDVIDGGANGTGYLGDILTGGQGADNFVFHFGESGGTTGRDLITDFVSGLDTITVQGPSPVFSGLQDGYVSIPDNPFGPTAELYYEWSFDGNLGALTHVHMRMDNQPEDDFEVLLQGHIALAADDFAFT